MGLVSVVDHMIWADRRTQEQLAAMAAGTAERESADSIYAHIAAAEHIWLSRLRGVAPTHDVWPALPPSEATELGNVTLRDLRRFVEASSPNALAATVTYANTAGKQFCNRADDIVMHVAMHGSYHRGQLALLARQGGSAAISTDYILFLRTRET